MLMNDSRSTVAAIWMISNPVVQQLAWGLWVLVCGSHSYAIADCR